MRNNMQYCCTDANCNQASLTAYDDGLHCTNGHVFPYITNTNVPLFTHEPVNGNDYSQENAVAIHDNSFQWVFKTFGTNESELRINLVSRLGLSKGQTILVTGAGSGNDIPFLAQQLEGQGTIYAQDISKQMLIAGVQKYASAKTTWGIDVFFSVSDATNLPFEDNFFDVAYHFGGLNLFPDVQKGISEMNRVVKPGGQVLICDEGIAPWLRETDLGKMLINNNPLYAYEAPLKLLPSNAQSVQLSWELNHCFFVIKFIVSNSPLSINIDVPHIGKRGGSIRTRYMGMLEGVDPDLRDKVYAAAEKQGISRVEYLERLLKTGCM